MTAGDGAAPAARQPPGPVGPRGLCFAPRAPDVVGDPARSARLPLARPPMSLRLLDVPSPVDWAGGIALAALALPDLSAANAWLDLLKLLGGVLLVLLVPFGQALYVRVYRRAKVEIMAIHAEWYATELRGNAETRAMLPHLKEELADVKESVSELTRAAQELAATTATLGVVTDRMAAVMDRMDERDRENATKIGAVVGQLELLRQTLKP